MAVNTILLGTSDPDPKGGRRERGKVEKKKKKKRKRR